MPNSKRILRDVVGAFQEDSGQMLSIFGDWWLGRYDIAFTNFWITNGAAIAKIARAAVNE